MNKDINVDQCPKCGTTINYEDCFCKTCWSEEEISPEHSSTSVLDKRIKYLKISYIIEMILGALMAAFMTLFLGVMATDSPSSSDLDFVIGALIGFVVVAVPTILIPLLAINELNNFKVKRRLIFNIINAIIVLIVVFAPLAFWQFYMLYKIKKD